MSSPITDLMQQVHDYFLSLYQTKNSVVNSETFLSFDSGASPPISIANFRQPNQADFSDVLAIEEFSQLVNQVPQLNANRFTPNGNQVEEQYEMLVMGGMSQSLTENDQVFFGRMRDQAEERLKNSKMGRARIGAPPIPYCQSFASPSNWYRPDAPSNWTSYTVTIAEQSKTAEQTKPVFRAAVKSAIALDLSQPWALQVLPQDLTAVLKQPEILDRIAVQDVAPQIDHALNKAAPIQFKREMLLQSVAEGNSNLLQSIRQPATLQINQLSQKIASFRPKELLERNFDDRVMIPRIKTVVRQPIATPILDRSTLVGRNWRLQELVNSQILAQSQTETIKSSQISVSFDYCWVNIDRRWFYNPYLQTHNWYIPGFQTGESTAKAFPAVPIAVLLVRNLRIQSNWQTQELQSVQSSMALGPFSLVGRSIEQGTGAIVQSGIQVMAWACQVMPTLPPSPSPL